MTETGKFKSLVNIPSLLLASRMVTLKGKNIIAHISVKSNNKHPSEERLVDVMNTKCVHAVLKTWTSGGQIKLKNIDFIPYIACLPLFITIYCVSNTVVHQII